ncbi:MAG: hypothetical protein N4A44_04335 [Alphaproteobacteria bacterium]|jgi:hypothetical protein|nr:hypothetical protein [Alphaproteobacteria bacterium]
MNSDSNQAALVGTNTGGRQSKMVPVPGMDLGKISRECRVPEEGYKPVDVDALWKEIEHEDILKTLVQDVKDSRKN